MKPVSKKERVMNDILSYVEPIYRFCLRRLSCREEAEDLAQEILLCLLEQNHAVSCPDAYVWQVARNRYARHLQRKNRDRAVLGEEDVLENLPAFGQGCCPEEETEEKWVRQEEAAAVFSALHSLSAQYRDILVEYYVHGLDTAAIAARHGIRRELVKWRLHTGREKMKVRVQHMNKTYERIRMHVMCNGSFHPNHYVNTQLSKAIVLACYEKPADIEAISLATGVPTLYLEEPLEHLVAGDALWEENGRYLTQFIILREADHRRMQEALAPSVRSLADHTWQLVRELTPSLAGVPTPPQWYSAKDTDAGENAGNWGALLIPLLIREACSQVKASLPELAPGPRPLRKDGGNGWFIVIEGIEGLDGQFSGCNWYTCSPTEGEPAFFSYYWQGDSFDEEINRILHLWAGRSGDISVSTGRLSDTDEEWTAHLLKAGLAQKTESGISCRFPVFTGKQWEELTRAVSACSKELISPVRQWMTELLRSYRTFTPPHLRDQIAGNIDSYSFNAAAPIMSALRQEGRIPVPESVFTDNIVYVRG